MEPTLDRSGLATKSKADLGDIAKSLGIKGTSSLRKEQIIDRILENTGRDGASRESAGAGPGGNGSGPRPERGAPARCWCGSRMGSSGRFSAPPRRGWRWRAPMSPTSPPAVATTKWQ